jgi:hypothetical protein
MVVGSSLLSVPSTSDSEQVVLSLDSNRNFTVASPAATVVRHFLNGAPVINGNFYYGTNFQTGADNIVATNTSQAVFWLNTSGNVGAIPWLASANITLNSTRNNLGNIYICRQAGTTASSGGPTGTTTGIVDGTVVWDYLSSDFVGSRSAFNSTLNIRAQNGPTANSDLYRNHVANLSTFQASANQGGTAPSAGNSAGNGYSGADQSWLLSGATDWSAIVGREIDVGVFNGASSKTRIGLNLVSFGDIPAAADDQGLAFNGRTIGFQNIIRLGEVSMTATNAIMSYFPRPQGSLNGTAYANPVAALGIDLSNIPFSTAAFRAPGNGGIDGSGNLFSGAASLSTSATAVSLDAPGSVVTAVAWAAGTLFKAGDQIYDTAGTGTIVTINTVNGSGVPTALTLTRAGGVLGSTPSNPVTFAGGSGIGSTLNLTWTRVAGLSLNPTGQKLGFNGTAPVAKPTVTGSKAANAALASLITALANYGLIVDTTT